MAHEAARRAAALLALSTLMLAAPAWAQFPAGTEFRVNTYTTNRQNYPSVASDSSGNFVVVWQSNYQDGSFNGVFGQRYDASGTPQGGG